MGFFITFEGVEGCGKSTQSRLLKERLDELAIPALLTHEPGVTPLGEEINRLLKWKTEIPVSSLAELLLFNASRAQLVSDVIQPALAKDTVVICDRYADSTTAYQGYGRQLDMDMVTRANAIGTSGLIPDRTFLLDVPVEQGMLRKRDDTPDRFEIEEVAFHQRVREGFLALAASEPQRWVIIDGLLPENIVFEKIWRNVCQVLSPGEHR